MTTDDPIAPPLAGGSCCAPAGPRAALALAPSTVAASAQLASVSCGPACRTAAACGCEDSTPQPGGSHDHRASGARGPGLAGAGQFVGQR